jgi:hypothetical protein
MKSLHFQQNDMEAKKEALTNSKVENEDHPKGEEVDKQDKMDRAERNGKGEKEKSEKADKPTQILSKVKTQSTRASSLRKGTRAPRNIDQV